MSTPVTEGHRELLHQLLMNVEHGYLKEAAQLIADSEARECAELRALVGTIRSQLKLIPRNVGDITPAEHSHETGAAIDQLRAEVERLKEYSGNLENDVKYLTQGVPEGDPLFLAVARAERAEADADSTRERALTLANSLDEAQAELAQFRELDAERARMRQIAVDKRIRTPTPQTDEEAGSLIDAEEVVPADFARTFERELAAERARVDQLILTHPLYDSRDQLDAAIKEGA